MRTLLWLLLALIVNHGLAQSTKPNIIIVYMDDMGYGDIEPFGMTGLSTPNFNKLAAEGLRLTNFNVAQAVCTASRAALLTGCYPNRLGLTGALLPESKLALNPEEQTIASLLKGNGYATAIFGKWHLGNRPPFFPLRYGFDSFYGLPYSHDIWPVDYHGQLITDTGNRRSKWPPLPIIENDRQIGTITSLTQQTHWTTSITERAVSFLKGHTQAPFFLYIAHPLPHVPLAVSEKFKGKSDLGLFGDVILELDWSLGEIMKTLDEQKLTENTILIVTSDNGPWVHFGNHAGSSGGLREGKGTPFEGGTRVPFLIRWPGHVAPGSVSGELVTNMDLLPTICALTKSNVPFKRIDGIDCSDFLVGKTKKSPREIFYYYYGNRLMGVRYQHWKLILPHQSQSYVHGGALGEDGVPGTLNASNTVRGGLYDLAHDPGEVYDISSLNPDVVEKIMKYVEEAREDLGDEIAGRKGNNIRHPAQVD